MIVVDESGVVWLYVVDPGEVSVNMRVDGYCDVWPAVVDSEG